MSNPERTPDLAATMEEHYEGLRSCYYRDVNVIAGRIVQKLKVGDIQTLQGLRDALYRACTKSQWVCDEHHAQVAILCSAASGRSLQAKPIALTSSPWYGPALYALKYDVKACMANHIQEWLEVE